LIIFIFAHINYRNNTYFDDNSHITVILINFIANYVFLIKGRQYIILLKNSIIQLISYLNIIKKWHKTS